MPCKAKRTETYPEDMRKVSAEQVPCNDRLAVRKTLFGSKKNTFWQYAK